MPKKTNRKNRGGYNITSISIDDELKARLKEYCKQASRSVSDIVCDVIESFLDKEAEDLLYDDTAETTETTETTETIEPIEEIDWLELTPEELQAELDKMQ